MNMQNVVAKAVCPNPLKQKKSTKTYNYKGIYKVSKQLKKLVKEQ